MKLTSGNPIIRVHKKFKQQLQEEQKSAEDIFNNKGLKVEPIGFTKITKIIADLMEKGDINLFRKNRKGQLGSDMLLYIIIIFITGIALVLLFIGINPALSAISSDLSAQGYSSASTIVARANTGLASFDRTFLYFIIADTLFIFASALLVNTVLAWFSFWIGIILLALANLFVPTLSNTFNSMLSNVDIANASANFPITRFILLNLPEYSIAVGITALILFVVKIRGSSGE